MRVQKIRNNFGSVRQRLKQLRACRPIRSKAETNRNFPALPSSYK